MLFELLLLLLLLVEVEADKATLDGALPGSVPAGQITGLLRGPTTGEL